MQDYKPNSNRFKEEQKKAAALEEKKVEKVVKGNVVVKKKSEMSKLKDIFIADDANNVKSYIFMDVLVPTIKKAIVDIGTDALNMIFLGGTNRSRTTSNSNVNYVSYNRFSDPRDQRPASEPRTRNMFDYDTMVYANKADAVAVIYYLNDIIRQYGFCTVADIYDSAGLSHPFTSCDYGWTNLRTAEVVRAYGGGYSLKLPKAMPIEK